MSACPPRSREDLLDLFASYFGEEEIRSVVGQLKTDRHAKFKAPDKILIVLFASRSGSNYFGQLICGTGWFNEIGESFAPHTLQRICEVHEFEDHHDAAQWVIDNRGTREAFGFKAGFYVLAAAAELGFLPEVLDRAQFVLLRRRDRVAQAVSRAKGKLSGRMHSLQTPGRTLDGGDYDVELIADHLRRTIKADADLAHMTVRLGKSAPVFYYEDICADPETHVRKVCELIGLPIGPRYNPDAKVRLSVLRDDLSKRWADRFRRERPELVAEAAQSATE